MALGYVRMWRCAAVFTLILLAAFFAGANAHFTSDLVNSFVLLSRCSAFSF
ncbi:hypothetical protein HanRHA438_Chr01g0017071 [Helianthus annuus]|nr:hypothetical protein HanRHA438_Chr01g0017071 [Helianthus annuus]